MPTLTPARSGLARSGATRSGYPIAIGTKVPLYALSGVARSGATRSNYHAPGAFLLLGGSRLSTLGGRLIQAIEIHETLGQPSTARFRVMGIEPHVGQDVSITLGSVNNVAREFGGQILGSELTYVEKPTTNWQFDVQCIDYTWGLNKRRVRARYLGQTVAAIAADLIATATAGYTLFVAPDIGAEVLDEITFTEQEVTDCFKQLTGRVGGRWVCDYQKVVRVFFDDLTATAPRIVNAVHPTLTRIALAKDLSQVLTRVTMEGGGPTSAAWVAAGETLLPLNGDPGWFDVAGGTVVSGPQRITYGTVRPGGGGSLVGSGAAPSGTPNVALLSGAGVTPGAHAYAVSYVTATGESRAGPTVSVTAGVHGEPATVPTIGAPTIGAGPNPGDHLYAVTFTTASGETLPSASVSASTGLTPAPTTAPVPGVPEVGAGVDDGSHEYAVTFVTSLPGETLPSPIGTMVIAGAVTPPDAPTATGAGTLAATGFEVGAHTYAVTALTDATHETTPGASLTVGPTPLPEFPTITQIVPNPTGQWGGGLTIGATYQYCATYSFSNSTFVTTQELVAGPIVSWVALPSANNPAYAALPRLTLTAGSSHAEIQLTKIYRTNANGSVFHVMTSQPGIFTGQTSDFSSDTDWQDTYQHPPLPTPGIYLNRRVLTIPTHPASSGITARKVYRTAANGSTLKLLTTLNNNSTTSYTDTTPDASLGATAPATNTAPAHRVPLTQIPRGDGSTSGGVVNRKLYRRSGGLGLRFLAALGNNSSTTYTDTTPNASLGAAPPTVSTAYLQQFTLTAIPLGDPLVTGRKVYRTAATGGSLKLLTTLAENTTKTFLDTVPDASLGAVVPSTNTATTQQVALSSIPIGASAVTSRKVYRTAAGASQLQWLTTLADNTTATYTDVLADGSLGANAPTIDNSGLQQPTGTVAQGSTTLIIATTAAFSATGGWCMIGNGQQTVRYAGITASSLTGIPASGPGAILASISYNSTATVPPMLTGIPASGAGAIRYPIPNGESVNLFVQVDDLAAQAALAALIGGDGIQVDHLQDRRLSATEAVARATAWLQLKRDVLLTVRYTVRDQNSRPGHKVLVNLGPPFNLFSVEFLIQSVTETALATVPRLPPTFDVVASSTRFTFDDLLRLIKRVT